MRAWAAEDPVSRHEQGTRYRLPGGVVGEDVGACWVDIGDLGRGLEVPSGVLQPLRSSRLIRLNGFD